MNILVYGIPVWDMGVLVFFVPVRVLFLQAKCRVVCVVPDPSVFGMRC